MDRITTSLLDEFSTDAQITSLPEDQRFEHFTAFLALTRFYNETLDTSEVVTGSGGDTGIDAIAVLVNGTLVTEPEVVDELAETNGFVDATFVFVQADRSSSFETAKIGQIGFGVGDFFKDKPTLTRNKQVSDAADIMNAVYARSSKFKRGNPACRVFYFTTGRWMGDKNLEARRTAVIDDLKQLGIFRDVEFTPVGADGIQKLYNQAKNTVSREFTFAQRTLIPEIPGVKEAYLGLIPAKEFVSLLEDESGGILKSLFYDNVRDWQNYNPVNNEIKTTLESDSQRARFALMNNGITIIAKTLRPTANKFHIEDYQIVNGCQTSHVLYDNLELLDDSVMVPLRLIATDNEEVIASIVKATNRQTEVKEEQLLALSDFQKKLEAYFQTFAPGKCLLYERRSRQYSAVSGVEKTRVVSPTNLIRTYASIFLEEPHRTTRSYRLLTQQLGKSIFGQDDKLDPYYYAASALYRLEFLFRNGLLDPKFKPARYQLLMAARLLSNPDRPPRTNSNDMVRYCKPLIDEIWDADRGEELMKQAAAIIEALAGSTFHRDDVRTETFTDKIKKACSTAVGVK